MYVSYVSTDVSNILALYQKLASKFHGLFAAVKWGLASRFHDFDFVYFKNLIDFGYSAVLLISVFNVDAP